MRQRDAAICLRTVDYSETSQVVHFLTSSFGVVHLLGKGSKRTKSSSGGAIDLMSQGDLVFISSEKGALGTLVEFSETTVHSDLRKDARKLNCALYMLEMTAAMLAEGDPYPEVFALLDKALRRLGAPDAPVNAVPAYFQWKLLRSVGLLGQLAECVVCDAAIPTAGGAYFSSRLGGLVCRLHETAAEEKIRVDGDAMTGLKAIAAADAGGSVDMSETQAQGVNRLLAYHAQQQLARAFRMARHVIKA